MLILAFFVIQDYEYVAVEEVSAKSGKRLETLFGWVEHDNSLVREQPDSIETIEEFGQTEVLRHIVHDWDELGCRSLILGA